MTKISIVVTFLLISSFHFAYPQSSQKIDSLKTVYKQTANTNKKMKLAEQLSLAYKNIQLDSARIYAQAMVKYAQETDNAKGVAMGYNWLGESFYLQGEYDSALCYFRKTNRIFGEDGPSDEWAKSLLLIANVFVMTNQYDSALILEQQALDYQLENDLSVSAGKTLVNISFIYGQKGNYIKAIELLIDARKRFKTAGDELWENTVVGRMATVYAHMDQHDSAISCYLRVIPYWESNDNNFVLAEIYNNLGTIYEAQENYEEALDAHQKSFSFRKSLNNHYGIAVSKMNIATIFMHKNQLDSAYYYLKPGLIFFKEKKVMHPYIHALMLKGKILHLRNQYNEALDNYNEAFGLANEHGFIEQQKDLSQRMSHLYEDIQNYEQALKYQRILKERSDSILNEENIKRQTRAEEQYKHELELFEKENELLIERRNRMYIIFIASGLFIIVLIIIFLRRKIYKTRLENVKKQNYIQMQQLKLEAQKLERQRVSRILHDNLAHLIFFVRKAVEQLKTETEHQKTEMKLIEVENNLELMEKMVRIASYELSFFFALENKFVDQCRQYIERMRHSQPVSIAFQADDHTNVDEMSDEVKINLFSVFQEMIGNAVKHAKAQHVNVYFYGDNGNVVLRIEDDGQGFDYKEVRHGQGIPNMKERANHLGGHCAIESDKGFGTKVRFEFPENH